MRSIFFVILILSQTLFAQFYPNSYQFKNENLSKFSDFTPASNSIQDIIASDNLIILGTSQGLSLSEDNGENWTNFYQSEPFGEDGSTAIGYKNGTIWATTGKTTVVNGEYLPEGTGIKYSLDNGTTWTSIPQPIDDPGDSSIIYGVNNIRALPITTTYNNISYDIAFTKNTVWIASFAGGLRKSTDMGITWERVVLPPDNLDSISPNDILDFTLQPVAGKFGQESWLNHRVFSVLGVNDSTLYVGTSGGINKSTDNGISWKKFNHQNQANPISGNFVVGFGFNEADNSIWAATWKAEDQDEYWAVSRSTDGGENWKTTLPNEQAHNFGFKYLDDGGSHVFIPTNNGIYRSNDNGISWVEPSEIKDALTNVSIETNIFYSAASNKTNTSDFNIWVGSHNGLARLSETNGFWEGDWKVYIVPTALKEKTSTLNNEFALAQNYPNPFNPSTTFSFTIPNSEFVTLSIYNSIGEKVASVVEKYLNSGTYSFNWTAKNLSTGIYFAHLISGNDIQIRKILLLK
ncbi:MAG: T9SS type A sorting domain-containing protein [Bacteroidetes bacterium]|nr:T9SS type A sorting domain-containing protein [Bacteroidota bacterium]MBU1115820.1 T9SS type A sorting domain-containing protein [Bacteroidota bacterium]MBU1800213.1 T9SS type A sorting domain-containing protein [Bacteroidota bacterium]